MKLKHLAAAVLAVAASVGAQAGGVIGVGPLPIPSSWTVGGTLSGLGTITDTWTFDTAVASNASASASNSFITIAGIGTLFDITNFTATLDGHTLNLSSTSSNSYNGVTQTTQTLAIAPFQMAAGMHDLKISGEVGASGGSYSATMALAAAPVPEPETLAMMLAGLGALGFLARRRQQD